MSWLNTVLWHSHDAEHHRQLHLGKQAFLSHSPRFICDMHRVLLKLYLVSIFGQYYGFCWKGKFNKSFEIEGKYFRAVLLTVHHKVNFGLQTMATFSQLEQCYAVLEQLFSPTFIYKFEHQFFWYRQITWRTLRNLNERTFG